MALVHYAACLHAAAGWAKLPRRLGLPLGPAVRGIGVSELIGALDDTWWRQERLLDLHRRLSHPMANSSCAQTALVPRGGWAKKRLAIWILTCVNDSQSPDALTAQANSSEGFTRE